MKNRIIFITGTDTNVGKTIALSALAYYFQQRKIKTGIIKAIQTGPDQDIKTIARLAKLDQKNTYCPIHLKYPLAPQQAAEIAKKPYIEPQQLINKIRNFALDYKLTLVEGSGGLYVPIRPGYMLIDLIKQLRADTIVVSRNALGTINQTILTIKALQNYKIPIKGLIFTKLPGNQSDLSEKLNPQAIQKITKIPILANFPYQKKINIPNLAKYITM